MKCNDDAMDEIRIGTFSVGEGRNCDQKYYSVADTLISPSTSVPKCGQALPTEPDYLNVPGADTLTLGRGNGF